MKLLNVEEGEPYFVLRASDPLAPDVLEHWARRAQSAQLGGGEAIPAHDEQAQRDALETATAMRAWRAERFV